MILARKLAGVLAVVASLSVSVSASAVAALQWQSPEALTGAPTLNLGPDSVGLLFGFPTSTALQQVIRPLGGPLGTPQALPAGMGLSGGYPPVVGWFPDGSSLIADPADRLVAFRPAGPGASIGTPQNLGSGAAPSVIATTPTGEALIGLEGKVGVAFRSAGPAGTVDMAHAQSFGNGRLIGVALDPSGGAVVVFIPEGTKALEQAVRKPGDASFENPVAIPNAGMYQVRMASDPSGNAVLAWMGGPKGTNEYGTQVTVSSRVPGGAFGSPQVIATEPAGEPTAILPAATANGDGLVAWTGGVHFTSCKNNSEPDPGNDADYGAFIATSHNGAWGPATVQAGAAWPSDSAIDGVASAGNTVAVAFHTAVDHDGKCEPPIDDSTESFVRTGSSGASGIQFDSEIPTVSELSNGKGQYYSAEFLGMAVNQLGGVLYEYFQYTGAGAIAYLLAREDHTAPPGEGGGGSGGAGGGGSGSQNTVAGTGKTGTQASGAANILPIVPRSLVILVPLDPANAFLVATCPPEVTDCAFRVGVYAAFGAVPVTASAKKAKLLGSATLTLGPGKHGRIKIRFNAAGKRALGVGRPLKVRVMVDVTAGAQHGSFTSSTTIIARHRHTSTHKKH